jgi:hypothetical protein
MLLLITDGEIISLLNSASLRDRVLTIKMGQTRVHRYLKPLFEKIESGQIDLSFVVTHTQPLEGAPNADELFKKKKDSCVKVVLNLSKRTIVIHPEMTQVKPFLLESFYICQHIIPGDG